jgi:hypothetical protein
MFFLSMLGAPAFSEGFLCTVKKDPDLNFFVEHFRSPSRGTRTAKQLFVYRSTIDEDTGKVDKELIAFFSKKLRTLKNQSTSYHAQVNLKLDETGAPGAYLLGTRLQYIDYMSLAIQFNYAKPVPHLTQVPGVLYVLKLNGDSETFDANCLRFLHGYADDESSAEFPDGDSEIDDSPGYDFQI